MTFVYARAVLGPFSGTSLGTSLDTLTQGSFRALEQHFGRSSLQGLTC